jgi:hypothetical protein
MRLIPRGVQEDRVVAGQESGPKFLLVPSLRSCSVVVIGAIPEITAVAVIVAPVIGTVPLVSATVTVAGVLGWIGADGRTDMAMVEARAVPTLKDVVTAPCW